MSTNGQIVQEVFGEMPIKELQIPSFINNYNQYMGGVDLANQYREVYESYKPTLRNWWPLFYWLIKVACINEYRLYQLYIDGNGRLLIHLQFRTELYYKLLGYSTRAKLRSLQVELGGKRVFNSDLPHLYYWGKHPKGTCIWYSYKLRYQKALGKAVDKKARAGRFHSGCVFCNINLYKAGEC
jgi:hypothetical protein